MKTVFKYQLPHPGAKDSFSINLPQDWKPLAVAQQGNYQLWALIDDTQVYIPVQFVWHGTGHPVADNEEHIATLQEPPFVWHLFYKKMIVDNTFQVQVCSCITGINQRCPMHGDTPKTITTTNVPPNAPMVYIDARDTLLEKYPELCSSHSNADGTNFLKAADALLYSAQLSHHLLARLKAVAQQMIDRGFVNDIFHLTQDDAYDIIEALGDLEIGNHERYHTQ